MKDSNNAVPEYDSRRNGHYAKSEQFLHITIVLLKADSIGGHGDGGDEKGGDGTWKATTTGLPLRIPENQ